MAGKKSTGKPKQNRINLIIDDDLAAALDKTRRYVFETRTSFARRAIVERIRSIKDNTDSKP